MTEQPEQECFVIMPISDPEGYANGHFKHVYQNIIKPSCKKAGYKALRGDEVGQTNLIQLDILTRLVEAPIVVCDLSSRNPNVLFELGIRQAFDKPVVLIQEEGTPKIFDISPLRYIEYSRQMQYHDVLDTQEELSSAITATVKAEDDSGNVNSIVRLLSLQAATIPQLESKDATFAFDLLRAEMREIRESIMLRDRELKSVRSVDSHLLIANLEAELRHILSRPLPKIEKVKRLIALSNRAENNQQNEDSDLLFMRTRILSAMQELESD